MAVDPAQFLQPAQERRDAGSAFRIVRGGAHKHPDAPHPLLLRARCERPRGGGAAEKRYELASFHSITSSARPISGSGMVRPSALAVLRLMTNSAFTDC